MRRTTKSAIGYVVSGAKCEFFDAGVDEKWTDFQSQRLLIGCGGAGLGEPLHCGPFAESDDVGFGRGGAGLSDEDGECQRCMEMALEDAEHGPRLSRKRAGGQGQRSQSSAIIPKQGSELGRSDAGQTFPSTSARRGLQ